MARVLVTLGTDGFTDWVQLPAGDRLNLGTISVLKLVASLAPSKRAARVALDAFLKEGEALVSVDEDRMWALFEPKRALWASDDGPFMAPDQRTANREDVMSLHENLTKLETHIQALNKAAANKLPVAKMAEGHEILTRLAQKIQVTEVSMPSAGTEGLAYDTVKANEATANEILVQAEATVEKIEKLAAAGKPFNADQAKVDVHSVTSKVAGILRDTDLTAPWIQPDLQKLASKMASIHQLFASAKV